MKAYKIVKRPLNTVERTELILNKMNDFYRSFNCGDLLCSDCKLHCVPNEKGEMGCIFQYISSDRNFLDRYNEKDDCIEERVPLEGRELQVSILAKSISDLIDCCEDNSVCNDCPLYTSDEHHLCPPDNPNVKEWVKKTLDGVVFEE
jgi:hypothetical protein